MNILVVGSSGDLGRALVGWFRGRGDHVECHARGIFPVHAVDGVVFLQRDRSGNFQAAMDCSISLTRHLIEGMLKGALLSPAASIVMVGSVASEYVCPEQDLGYHVGKAGMLQMARYYALKLAPIRVNTVSPCVVLKTGVPFPARPELIARFEKFIPLGRRGIAQDIINAIEFLLSNKAAYITGQNIVVDGGLTLRSHESMLREI